MNSYIILNLDLYLRYAHKKGEVVGSAGGETDEPRCLAEVHIAANSSIISIFKWLFGTLTCIRETVKQKNKKNQIPPGEHDTPIFSGLKYYDYNSCNNKMQAKNQKF